MYICYIDESGPTKYVARNNVTHFILLGLAIPVSTWKDKDESITRIKVQYDIDGHEIHTGWMMRQYREQDQIPDFTALSHHDRKQAVRAIRAMRLARARDRRETKSLNTEFKKTDAYIHLTLDERIACLDEIVDAINGWSDSRIFADANDVKITGGVNAFEFAFAQVVTRFNTFLETTPTDYGMLVHDNNQTVCRRLTESMRKYHRDGTLWSEISRVIETPLFVDSALTSMVQMADVCAYALRRFCERGETRLFDKIYPIADRRGGKLVGIRHFTAKTECRCRICIDHGR